MGKPLCQCGTCVRCINRVKARRYRERHPDRAAASRAKWNEANPDGQTEATARWRAANPQIYKAQRARYRRSPAGRAARQAARLRSLDQTKARNALIHAVKMGRVVRGPCERCGSTLFVQAHHTDYSKPLDVRWLCPEHHRMEHDHMTKSGG